MEHFVHTLLFISATARTFLTPPARYTSTFYWAFSGYFTALPLSLVPFCIHFYRYILRTIHLFIVEIHSWYVGVPASASAPSSACFCGTHFQDSVHLLLLIAFLCTLLFSAFSSSTRTFRYVRLHSLALVGLIGLPPISCRPPPISTDSHHWPFSHEHWDLTAFSSRPHSFGSVIRHHTFISFQPDRCCICIFIFCVFPGATFILLGMFLHHSCFLCCCGATAESVPRRTP